MEVYVGQLRSYLHSQSDPAARLLTRYPTIQCHIPVDLRLQDTHCPILCSQMSYHLARTFKEQSPKNSGVPRNFVWGGGSTNSVEDRGQREQGSGGVAP